MSIKRCSRISFVVLWNGASPPRLRVFEAPVDPTIRPPSGGSGAPEAELARARIVTRTRLQARDVVMFVYPLTAPVRIPRLRWPDYAPKPTPATRVFDPGRRRPLSPGRFSSLRTRLAATGR